MSPISNSRNHPIEPKFTNSHEMPHRAQIHENAPSSPNFMENADFWREVTIFGLLILGPFSRYFGPESSIKLLSKKLHLACHGSRFLTGNPEVILYQPERIHSGLIGDPKIWGPGTIIRDPKSCQIGSHVSDLMSPISWKYLILEEGHDLWFANFGPFFEIFWPRILN